MARADRNRGFAALKVEGSIFSPEFLHTVASLQAPQQSDIDYGLSKSLTLKEELARYWRIANDFYDRYSNSKPRLDLDSRDVCINRWLVPLLRSLLGYDDLRGSEDVLRENRVFRLTHRACNGGLPFLLLTHDYDLDRADLRASSNGRPQAPHASMQEYLNADRSVLWGMVANGSKLRILRENVSLTRPSYLEVDLDLIFEEKLYPDFVALWLLAHCSRFKSIGDSPSQCIMESWRVKAHETGERAREKLRVGVSDALRQLGNGFLQHSKNTKLRVSVETGEISADLFFQQLLRLVYRLLFLFSAEERNLLYAPEATKSQRELYAEGYSLSRLRERALRRRHYDTNQDLWQGLKITFESLAKGATELGLAPLGGLFSKDQCPDLDDAAIANDRLLKAVFDLSFFPSSGAMLSRVNYRDMDTEELGSVYESLLELQPVIDPYASTSAFGFASDTGESQNPGSERKLTGSYYTPPSLVNELVKSTIDPVIEERVSSNMQDPRAALLGIRVVDPACGSGHFLLATARRIAAEITHIDSARIEPEEATRQKALREVVQHCIYGVDRNQLAVELCRTALWIETLEPGKPLTFLDSHILEGDSLVGVIDPDTMEGGIPSDAYRALTGDDKKVCKQLSRRNRQLDQLNLFAGEDVLEIAFANLDLESLPEETLEDIERKRSAWNSTRGQETRIRETLRANLFVGAFLAEKTKETSEIVPQTQDLNLLRRGNPLRQGVEEFVWELSDRHQFFHWYLEFAEVLQDGGFDAVIGNPPWERIKLQEQEFFAFRSPQIAAAPNKASRDRLIGALDSDDASEPDRNLHRQFQAAKHGAEAISQFARRGGRFPLTAKGDINTYAIFAETFLHLLNPIGRAGMIVPTGIATDDSTKSFFRHLVNRNRLISLFDFENKDAIFRSVHRSYKFSLLTVSGNEDTREHAEFAFFLHKAEQLKDEERRFQLTADDFSLFNPNTRTCPIFRSRKDMEIARKMYRRSGVFWKEGGDWTRDENPWGASFQRMFDMANDSDLFRTQQELTAEGWHLQGNVFVMGGKRYLPLYEAKLFHQYDHRFASFEGVSERDKRKGSARNLTTNEKSDPTKVSIPRYWVSEQEVIRRLDASDVTASQRKAEPSRAEPSRAEPSRAEPSRAEPLYSKSSQKWQYVVSQEYYKGDRRKGNDLFVHSSSGIRAFRHDGYSWLVVFRDIASPTNQRTAIFAAVKATGMNHKAPILKIDHRSWLQAFRGITNATNERTLLADHVAIGGLGHSAPTIGYQTARAVASTLVLANMNSLILDWAARFSVGGVNLSFFIIKQLPVLPPEAYICESACGHPYVELVIPRALELVYTSNEMSGFAKDLGYEGSPFPWDDQRRLYLRCELDAIFAHMYELDRSDLEWILDASSPSSSFPALKQREMREFGEYRTQQYVLGAYDLLASGDNPDLTSNHR